jgi:hypothetical protein
MLAPSFCWWHPFCCWLAPPKLFFSLVSPLWRGMSFQGLGTSSQKGLGHVNILKNIKIRILVTLLNWFEWKKRWVFWVLKDQTWE